MATSAVTSSLKLYRHAAAAAASKSHSPFGTKKLNGVQNILRLVLLRRPRRTPLYDIWVWCGVVELALRQEAQDQFVPKSNTTAAANATSFECQKRWQKRRGQKMRHMDRLMDKG